MHWKPVIHAIRKRSLQLVQPIIRLWRKIPLRVQGQIFVALPLLSIVISAVLAIIGNYQRAGIEVALQRHIQTIHTSNDVLILMVNAETGMRGYLLTRREEFLQPYNAASQQLAPAMTNLLTLANTEPGDDVRQEKLGQVAQLQQLVDQQIADLAWQQQHADTPELLNAELYTHLAYGKRLMDAIRQGVATMQSQEEQLLTARLEEINAIRKRDYVAIFLTLCVGLGARLVAWYLFHTGVTWRIEALVSYVRAVRQGQSVPLPRSGKQDTLGDLEREITLLDPQLAQSVEARATSERV